MVKESGSYRVLIVSAGCSRKMKTFKPLLPLGNHTILENTIHNFQKAGMDDIVVVVGYKRRELIPILKRLGVKVAINEDYDQTDMLESVKIGLRVMPADTRGVLLCPVDIPLILPSTIKELVETGKKSDALAVIPAYQGQWGHPLLFGRRIASEILRYYGDHGIRGVLRKFSDRIQCIDVPDANMLMNINRPEDYEKLVQIYNYQKNEILNEL